MFEIEGGSGRINCNIVSCSQGQVVVCPSLKHNGPDASTCPQAVIFSSAPGGQLFSQKPGQALSAVSETKALTYTLLARLITFNLKLKFSNSWVPYQFQWGYLFRDLQGAPGQVPAMPQQSDTHVCTWQWPRTDGLWGPAQKWGWVSRDWVLSSVLRMHGENFCLVSQTDVLPCNAGKQSQLGVFVPHSYSFF